MLLQEEAWLSCVYFLCCPAASVIQMIMELEEREPGVMRWGGFVKNGGTAHLKGLLGAETNAGGTP